MYLEKRGKIWWYEFRFEGKRYRLNSGVGNKNDAREIASAYRPALARGEVGITERKKFPHSKGR
jgi:hypothetical protein